MRSTNTSLIRNTLGLSLLAALPLLGQAQEVARVLSSTPVVTQVAVPRQICSQSQMVVAPPKSGAGALVGAVAGGALGSTIGGGSGRALATAAGMIGGAMVGDSMTPSPPPILQPVTSCTHQVSYENRISAYNVVYEYAGRQYSTQMPNDPGPYLPIQASAPVAVAPAVVVAQPYPAPVWYGAPSYGPGVALRFGYNSGYGSYGAYGGWREHHHHWR